MANYVVLIRGVGPSNPATRNEKLARVLESVGCRNVRPILTSGNLVFCSKARSGAGLEARIEKAFRENLDLSNEALVRSQSELEAIVNADPFESAEHGKQWYLTVTFRKDREPPIFSRFQREGMDGPAAMLALEKRYGKHITTRTWSTLLKIMAKMESCD